MKYRERSKDAELIVGLCALAFGVPTQAVRYSRHLKAFWARMAAMNALRIWCKWRLMDIGLVFDRHHTTVMNALEQHEYRLSDSPQYAEGYERILALMAHHGIIPQEALTGAKGGTHDFQVQRTDRQAAFC